MMVSVDLLVLGGDNWGLLGNDDHFIGFSGFIGV
jgi:hypothetical protein